MSPDNGGYDLHPDGERVAAAVLPEQASSVQDKVVFVFNFGDYLRTITSNGAYGAYGAWGAYGWVRLGTGRSDGGTQGSGQYFRWG